MFGSSSFCSFCVTGGIASPSGGCLIGVGSEISGCDSVAVVDCVGLVCCCTVKACEDGETEGGEDLLTFSGSCSEDGDCVTVGSEVLNSLKLLEPKRKIKMMTIKMLLWFQVKNNSCDCDELINHNMLLSAVQICVLHILQYLS